jgi:hypothetical protein
VELRCNGGVVGEGVSIAWTAVNLLEAGSVTIRKDDSLKLTAHPPGASEGTVSISIFGGASYETTVGEPVVHQFSTPGQYTVCGTYAGAQTRCIVVTVIGGGFPSVSPAVLLAARRTWTCPDLPAEAVLESDSTVQLSRFSTGVYVTMRNVSAEHYVVARLPAGAGGAPGAVLDSAKLNGFWVRGGADALSFVVERHATYEVWENVLLAKNLPPDVNLHINIFISGVTFIEGGTFRIINSSHFNSVGEYRFRLIHPNSVNASTCHTVTMYQNGYIGEAYYGSYLPVEE